MNASPVREYLKGGCDPPFKKQLLGVLGLKLLQELDESLSALDGHGVVNAGAQTADALVALSGGGLRGAVYSPMLLRYLNTLPQQ